MTLKQQLTKNELQMFVALGYDRQIQDNKLSVSALYNKAYNDSFICETSGTYTELIRQKWQNLSTKI